MGISRVCDSESEGYDDDFAERRAIDVTGRVYAENTFLEMALWVGAISAGRSKVKQSSMAAF